MTHKYLTANGLQIAYDEFGNPKHPAIVLVMGLGSQMVHWPIDFCQDLADGGFRVIRFDNRDIGLSDKITVTSEPSVPKIMLLKALGLPVSVPYDLHDMAMDAVGVLDALNIPAAHWVGVSMGGMISQIVAAQFPEKCLSLSSIMSTSGNPRLPQASLKIRRQLLKRPPTNNTEDYIEHTLVTRKMIASPGFPISDKELRERIVSAYERSFYPQGYRNQMVAIMATGDRRRLLKKIIAPTLVLHGHDDPLVPVDGGIDTARHIQHANLHLIDGMGHDLPPGVCDLIVEHVHAHIDRNSSAKRAA